MKQRIQIFNYNQKYISKNPFEMNSKKLNPLYYSKSKKVLFSSVKLGKKNIFKNSISFYLKRNNISNEKKIAKKYTNQIRLNRIENSQEIKNCNILSKNISISDMSKERFYKKYNSNNNKFKNKIFCSKDKSYNRNKFNNKEINENINLTENNELKILDIKKSFKNNNAINTIHTNSRNTCFYLRNNNFLDTNKCSIIRLDKKTTIKLIRFPKNYFSSISKNNILSKNNISKKHIINKTIEKQSSSNLVNKDNIKNKKDIIKEMNNSNGFKINNKISNKKNICKKKLENNIKTQKIIKISDNSNLGKDLTLKEKFLPPFLRTNKKIGKNIKKIEINKCNNNISSKPTYYTSFLNSEKNLIEPKTPYFAIQNNKNKNPIKRVKAKENIFLDLSIDSIEKNTQSKFLNYELGESDIKSTINYNLDNNSDTQNNRINESKKIEYEAPIEEIEKIAYEVINNSNFIDKRKSLIYNRLPK